METRLSIFCDKVIEAGWLAVAVVLPFYFNVYSSRVFEPDKLTWLRIIALVMAVAWIVRTAELGRGWSALKRGFKPYLRENPLALPTLLLVFMMIVSTIFSVSPDVSFWGSYQRMQGTLTFLSYIVVFFLAATHIRTRVQVDRLITVMLWTSLPIALYGIVQHLRLDPLPWGGDVTARVTANLGNAIFLAAYLIMAVPLALFRFISNFRELISQSQTSGVDAPPTAQLWVRSLVTGSYGVLIVLQVAAILFSKSRGPWLGLVAGLAIFALLAALRYRRRALAAATVALGVAFVAFVVVLNLNNSPLAGLKQQSEYLERLGSVLDLQTGTNRVRTLIWAGDEQAGGALALIASDPVRMVIGHGPETMHFAFSRFYPPDLAHLESRTATPDRSHNDVLDRLVMTGIIGLVLYLAVLVTFYRLAIVQLWRSASTYHQLFLLAMIGAITAHVVEVIFGIAIASTISYFWIMLALVVAWRVPSAQAAPAVAPAANGRDGKAYESRVSTQRRRPGRAERHAVSVQPKNQSVADSVFAVLPGLRRGSVWVIAGYTLATFVLFGIFSVAGLGRFMEPPVLMMSELGWLLFGMYLATFWAQRAEKPRINWRSRFAWAYLILWLLTLIIAVRVLLATVVADIYFKQAQGIEQAGDFAQAIPRHLSAVQWQPGQDYYYLFLGRAYSELARRVPDAPARLQLASVNDLFQTPPQQIQSREDAFRASETALNEAFRINPLNVDNAANLGRLYRMWGSNTADQERREELLRKSDAAYLTGTTLSPNTAHLWNEWGLTLITMNQFDQGIEKIQHAIQLDPTFDQSYQFLGEAYFQAKRYDEALVALQKAAEVNDRILGVHSMLGFIYYEKGDIQNALKENLKAVEIAPNDVPSHRNLVQIYRNLGNKQKALEHLDIAIRATPENQRQPLQALRQQIEAEMP